MGIAAYNRGSRVITDQILREQARYRGDTVKPVPKPRPPTWGNKAMARAVARATSVLRANRLYDREVPLDLLIEIVQEREHVGRKTAAEAARIAMNKVT